MAKKESYIPRAGDVVIMQAISAPFSVIDVDPENRTANLEAISGNILVMRDVPWALLTRLDATESELAARMKEKGQKPNERYLSYPDRSNP